MKNKTFQYELARAILRSTNGLEYDDAVELVRLIAPEAQKFIAHKEQMVLEEKQKKKPAGKLDYIKVL